MSKTGSIRLYAWCSCGASFRASSTPPEAAEYCFRIFWERHDKLGHRPVDKDEARRIRRRERRLETRNEVGA